MIAPPGNTELVDRYLGLLGDALLGVNHGEGFIEIVPPRRPPKRWIVRALHRRGLRLIRPVEREQIEEGRVWPLIGESLIGRARIANLRHCVEEALRGGVPGDLIEAGVWRGGAGIFMRGILAAHGVEDRRVWLADSFAGLPAPDQRYPADAGSHLHEVAQLAVSLEEVRRNFERYGLLDDRVEFVPGWFADTLPALRDRHWAVVRLDGDLYESTIQALESLYPGLSPGGFLIVDDYGALDSCREAVDDFRRDRDIPEPIEWIDHSGIYWRRSR